MTHRIRTTALSLAAALLLPLGLMAQSPLAQQQLGRPYWHVFIAYALCWLILGGWLFHIVRRLKKVEERLGSRDD